MRTIRKLALAALVFTLGLVACELGFRAWLGISGREPFDAAAVKERLELAIMPKNAIVASIGGRMPTRPDGNPAGVLHPFTGLENMHDTGGVLDYFHRGVPENEYSVVVVGGSVATLFANTGGGELAQLLARDPRLAGKSVRVLDYAHPAYKQPQQAMRLAYLLSLGYRPDAVINIDGFNEVALGYDNSLSGIHPLYPTFPIWGFLVQDFGSMDPEMLEWTLEMWDLRREARALGDRGLRWKLDKSCIASQIVLHRLSAIDARRVELQKLISASAGKRAENSGLKRQLDGPDFDRRPRFVFEECLDNWFESSLSIQALCQSRGIAYLHVLQPTLHDPGAKLLTEKEKALPGPEQWRASVVRGYPMLRARSKSLEQCGIHFLDASRVFATTSETLYFDTCHFNEIGDGILARFIAPYFLEHALLPSGSTASAHLNGIAPEEKH